MNVINLTHDQLNLEEAVSEVSDPSSGAINIFMGTTRDTFDGKHVVQLEYQAYDSMATKEIERVCGDCRKKYKIKNIAVHHRLGLVPVKEASVIIAVSAEHRKDAFHATRFLIDSIKECVPIWKKEYYTEEQPVWKENCGNNPPIEGDVHYHSDIECDVVMEDVGEYDADDDDDDLDDFDDFEDDDDDLDDDDDDDDGFTDSEYSSSSSSQEDTAKKVRKSMIQIKGNKSELDRRIKSFQKKIRHDLDELNKVEFCRVTDGDNPNDSEGVSCARTNALVLRPKGSNSHLKVTKVKNEWGPQTDSTDILSQPGPSSRDMDASTSSTKDDKAKVKSSRNKSVRFALPEAVEERLSGIEDHLKMESTDSKPVHARLKAIEDRLLALEAISPEYFKDSVLRALPRSREVPDALDEDEDEEINMDDIDNRMFVLKKKLKDRQLGQADSEEDDDLDEL